MKLTDPIHLVGSGEVGISDPNDCHVYLLNGGDSYALIDAGCGSERSIAAILANIEQDGLDRQRVRSVVLTHSHFDHAGGASAFREQLGCRVYAPAGERAFVEAGRSRIPARPVDVALRNVRGMIVPFCIGQSGVPLLPWDFPASDPPEGS